MKKIKHFIVSLLIAPFFILACICEDVFKNLNPVSIFLALCITLSGGILIGKYLDNGKHRCYITGKMIAYELVVKINNPNFRGLVSKEDVDYCGESK